MSDCRLLEIVSRAVVGRAERRMRWSHTVTADGVTGVLGVHITDSAISVKSKDGKAKVDVLVDCDLWCGNDRNTKVVGCTSRNTENLGIKTVGKVLGEPDLSAKLHGLARATGVEVGDEEITIHLEMDYSVTAEGQCRMWVKAYDLEAAVLGDLDDPESDSDSDSSSEE